MCLSRFFPFFPRSVVFAAAFACALVIALPRRAAALDAPYTMSSDYIMFDIDKKVVYCEGQSELLYKLLRIQAKTIRVDVKTHVLLAEGDVIVTTMAGGGAGTPAPGEPAAAQPGAGSQTLSEEADARLSLEVDSRINGQRNSYQGDQLRFDLERMAGILLQTRSEVKRIYIAGETLDEVSEVPKMGEGILYDEPYLNTNAVTSVRFRVSPGDQYEAWRARLWVKGNKVINVPYYTNTSRKVTPGNWRLKNVRYSSNSDWSVGASIRYKKERDSQGFFDIVYSADGRRRYSANLRQAFSMGRQTGGVLSMNGLFGGDRGYGLSLSRHMGATRSASLNLNYLREGPIGMQFSGNTSWNGMRVRGFLHARRFHTGNQSSLNALVDIDGKTHLIGKKRNFGYQCNSSLKLGNEKNRDAEGSVFVAASAFRSGIELTNRSRVSLSVSTGLGMDTEGAARNTVGSSVTYSIITGRNRLISSSYRTKSSRSNGNTSAEQYVSASYSISKSNRWRTTIGTSYDLRKTELGSYTATMDYVFSKKCRLWSNLTYDSKLDRFSSKNYNLSYDVYGTTVNTNWFVETNDFSFDFSTNFR